MVTVADILSGQDAMLVLLKANLEKALQAMVKQANMHHREVVFHIGDKVFSKL